MIDVFLAVELVERDLADGFIRQCEVVDVGDLVLIGVEIHEHELRIRRDDGVVDLRDDQRLRRALLERADVFCVEYRQARNRIKAEARVHDLDEAHARQDIDCDTGLLRELAQEHDRALGDERAAGHGVDEVPLLCCAVQQVLGDVMVKRLKVGCFFVEAVVRGKRQASLLDVGDGRMDARAQDKAFSLLHDLPRLQGDEPEAARSQSDDGDLWLFHSYSFPFLAELLFPASFLVFWSRSACSFALAVNASSSPDAIMSRRVTKFVIFFL